MHVFDFHNHFTDINAFKYSAELLPENISFPYDINLIRCSEIGLDARFAEKLDMELQEKELIQMLTFAKDKNIPVSLHCVRATGKMLNVLNQIKLQPLKAVWHNFTSSVEVAAELEKLGVIISISPRFNGELQAVFNANQFSVLETDYTGKNPEEYSRILAEHYLNCSCKLDITLMELEARCNELRLAFKN